MFIIAIFFVIVLSLFVYTSNLNRYNTVANSRNQDDWERENEKIAIPALSIDAGTLNIAVSNVGGVTAHLVQMWITKFKSIGNYDPVWQTQYAIDTYISPGETIPNYGSSGKFIKIIVTTTVTTTVLNSLTSFDSSSHYIVKIVTARGNAAISEYPQTFYSTIFSSGGTGYPLVIEDGNGNFQYSAGVVDKYRSAYVKPKGTDQTIYRLKIRNTTNKTIVLEADTSMIQLQSDVQLGQTALRYVVSNSSTNSGGLVNFGSQTINPGAEQYLYFAAISPGGTDWYKETQNKGDTLVGFMMWFHYYGETYRRTIGLPALYQRITT